MSGCDVYVAMWDGRGRTAERQRSHKASDIIKLWHGLQRCIPGSKLTVLTDSHYYVPLINGLDHYVDERVKRSLRQRQTCDHPLYRTLDIRNVTTRQAGGWSPALEAFNPRLHTQRRVYDRALLVELDTVITGDCSWLYNWVEAPVGLPVDPRDTDSVCAPVVTFNVEGAQLVWDEYTRTNGMVPFPHQRGGKPSSVALLKHLWKRNGWPMLETTPDRLLSYSDCGLAGQGPQECSMVYCNEPLQPSDIPRGEWVRRVWDR